MHPTLHSVVFIPELCCHMVYPDRELCFNISFEHQPTFQASGSSAFLKDTSPVWGRYNKISVLDNFLSTLRNLAKELSGCICVI